MALLLVVAVLAMAAVLGYAMLNVNTLQSKLASNLTQTAGAEYSAEAGVRVASYYLQYPAAAPVNWTNTSGYKLYSVAVPINDGTSGSFDLTAVKGPKRNVYLLQSTGRSTALSPYVHSATAKITIARVGISGAGLFGGNIVVPNHSTFSDGGVSGAVAVQASGTVTASSGSVINGTIVRGPLSASAYTAPTAANVNYYGVGMSGGTYLCYDGVTLGTPQLISASSIKTASIPAVAANNPGGVFYHNGNVTISGTFTLPGTLIIRGGTLTISSNATITAKVGYPALVCEQGVVLSGANRSFSANGVVFIGGNYAWSGTNTNSKFQINGALVMPAGSAIGTTNNGAMSVIYSSATVNVPDLTTFDQPGLSVLVNSWTQ